MNDFSPKHEKLLSALLVEKDLRAASLAAGISETTAWRYLSDADFKTEYRKRRREAVEQAAASLQRAASEAVETLRKNLSCGHPAAENVAAKTILEQAAKTVEIFDLAERLEVIEHELSKTQAAKTAKNNN